MGTFWKRPDAALTAAGIEGEWLVARVRLVVMGLLVLTPTYKLFRYPGVPVFIWGFWVTLIAGLMALAVWVTLRRGWWRSWFGFFSSALDVSLVTVALATFVYAGGPLVALNSKVTFEIYFLALGALSLRYDTRICVVVGLLAVLEYAGLWAVLAWRYDLGDPAYAIGVGVHAVIDQVTRLILMSAMVVLSVAIVLRARRLLHLAARDRLTGLYNRGQFDQVFIQEVENAKRQGQSLVVAVLDLDHFKRVNDTHGHAAGDRVLVAVAAHLTQNLRATDFVARYGGEEFVILMPQTSREDAIARLEALRAGFERLPLTMIEQERLSVTCSAGIAELPADGRDTAVLIARADYRLMAAKRAGRDRVHSVDPEPRGVVTSLQASR